MPFVGLAEALVLSALRRSEVPLQRIRPALAHLQREIGLEHALASRRLYTDGAELLFDYGESHADTPDGAGARTLVVVRSGQRVFADVVHDYLRRIEYGADGYASLIHVPAYAHAQVVADPSRSFGAPIFERGGARVDDVLQRFWAGDSLDALSAGSASPSTSSRTCCVSHPDGLPDLFLDRSLGRIVVPSLLRAAGLRLTTLAEHYGVPADEKVKDEHWLRLAGTQGWVVFMKDARVRYNLAEREAVKELSVRCFCLSSQNLRAGDMAARFIGNLDTIVAACVDTTARSSTPSTTTGLSALRSVTPEKFLRFDSSRDFGSSPA